MIRLPQSAMGRHYILYANFGLSFKILLVYLGEVMVKTELEKEPR